MALETDDLRKQARIFRQKLQVMLESQLEVVKGSEWDDILQQGETTSYEAIQEAIRHDDTLDKSNAKEVKSFSNDTDAENEVYVADNTPVSEPVEETKETETVVIFPDSNDNASSQRFADDSNNN